MHNVIA